MEGHWLCFVLFLELGQLSFWTKGLPLRPKFVLLSSVFVPERQAEGSGGHEGRFRLTGSRTQKAKYSQNRRETLVPLRPENESQPLATSTGGLRSKAWEWSVLTH